MAADARADVDGTLRREGERDESGGALGGRQATAPVSPGAGERVKPAAALLERPEQCALLAPARRAPRPGRAARRPGRRASGGRAGEPPDRRPGAVARQAPEIPASATCRGSCARQSRSSSLHVLVLLGRQRALRSFASARQVPPEARSRRALPVPRRVLRMLAPRDGAGRDECRGLAAPTAIALAGAQVFRAIEAAIRVRRLSALSFAVCQTPEEPPRRSHRATVAIGCSAAASRRDSNSASIRLSITGRLCFSLRGFGLLHEPGRIQPTFPRFS